LISDMSPASEQHASARGRGIPASRKRNPELGQHVEMAGTNQGTAGLTGSQALASQVHGNHAR
jgi:hypothetical protein